MGEEVPGLLGTGHQGLISSVDEEGNRCVLCFCVSALGIVSCSLQTQSMHRCHISSVDEEGNRCVLCVGVQASGVSYCC